MGWFEDQKYPDGQPVAYIAGIQEFGWAPRGIPPRLGMRALAQEKGGEWAKAAGDAAKICIESGRSGETIFQIVAQFMAGDMKQRISQIISPPLAQSTIDARLARREKGSKGAAKRALKAAAKQREKGLPVTLEKPLVDTGYLLRTVIGKAVKV